MTLAIVETRAITGGVDTGYARLLGWLGGFGTVCLVGIEGTGSYGAGLARHLAAAGVRRSLTRMQLIRTCAAWRPDLTDAADPVSATRIALKSLARRILELGDEIAMLDELIKPIVTNLAPQLLERTGIGIEIAGQLLVTAGDNHQRLRTEAGFAMLCGVAPLPASSGHTRRHRLNRGGDRQANSALHLAVISRIRMDEHPGLRCPQDRRRPLQTGDHPLPEALPRPRGLLPPQPGQPTAAKQPGKINIAA
jgi:transposase